MINWLYLFIYFSILYIIYVLEEVCRIILVLKIPPTGV